MTIPRVAAGAFADVLDMADGTVVKAYRRQQHTSGPVQDWRDHEALTRGYFEFEAAAYERLQRYPDLLVFTPRFLGRIDPAALSDLEDPPELGYLRACGIRLEKVPGEDIKVSRLSQQLRTEVEAVLDRLRDEVQAGHVWDASCFVPGTRAPFTLIDFATWDDFSDWHMQLKEQGTFSDEQRLELSSWRGVVQPNKRLERAGAGVLADVLASSAGRSAAMRSAP